MAKKETEKVKIVTRILKHFAKHYRKYCAFLLCAGLAFSGFSVKTKFFSCNKTKPQIPMISKDGPK